MKVADYRGDICKESLVNSDVFIGFGAKDDSPELIPVPVEEADNHICVDCLDELTEFREKWKRRDAMSPEEKHAWGLRW